MLRTIIAATVVAAASFATSASAATLSGDFDISIVNVTNVTKAESKATIANYDAAMAGTLGGANSVSSEVVGSYDGLIDFGTYLNSGPTEDDTTILDWLLSGTENSFGLAGDSDLQLSKDNIKKGTATSTFFLFTLKSYLGSSNFEITHDDGVQVFDDGVALGGFAGPNGVRTTTVNGFNGGELSFLYVATNGDPSVLEIDIQPVPLPATLPLLLAGFGGLAIMRRKRAA